ncbi:MAG: hypothetical protein KIT80_03015 [Chitinophagaceae bacterium]|nr:hypothetical protein [Chitinophagaceae bacterium]MCW5925856.1 hypothetical protein [Chitinophagaceae bacterium]
MLNIITQNHIIEFTALVVSIFCWPALKKSKLRWLPFFLFFVLLVELAGSVLPRVYKIENAWLYNFSIPAEYGFYLYLFYIHGKRRLRIISFLGIVVVSIVCILSFLLQNFRELHDKVLLAGQVSVVVCCCVYIYECFIELSDLPLFRDYFFWITSGLLMFNLGNLGYVFLFPLMRDEGFDEFGHTFRIINNSFLLLLYVSFIVAIIILKKADKNVERIT